MEGEEMETQDEVPYPNILYDPEPLYVNTASDAEIKRYSQKIHKMGEDLLIAFREAYLVGEDLWINFISAFRSHTIKNWNFALLTGWTSMLIRRDVHVVRGGSVDKAQSLIKLQYK